MNTNHAYACRPTLLPPPFDQQKRLKIPRGWFGSVFVSVTGSFLLAVLRPELLTVFWIPYGPFPSEDPLFFD